MRKSNKILTILNIVGKKFKKVNFLHERDLGDIILSLASVQAAGGGNYYIKNNTNAVRMLAPLIESQPYINKCGEYNGETIDKSFVNFRENGHPFGVQLAKLHADWINQPVDLNKPWLFCEKNNSFNGRIIVNRTNRYNNNLFPWDELTELLKNKILFVGTNEEYNDFNNSFGRVERLIINNYLDLAIAINSCECFIGNQSSSNCLAEGLKHNSILEVSLEVPDCIYKRDNAYHSCDGSVVKKIGSLNINIPPKEIKEPIDKSVSPNGGWKYYFRGNYIKSYCIKQLIQIVKQNNIDDNSINIENKIIEDTKPYIQLSYNLQMLKNKITNVSNIICN